MNTFQKHELFEIEVLEKLKNKNLLNSFVFGGGTMLRLCYELNRYSVDLDFFLLKKINIEKFFIDTKKTLEKYYEITDSKIKQNTVLFEIKASEYPRILKIEFRKKVVDYDYQNQIAFSKFGNTQVILNVLTLEQALKNKVAAALDRKIIRDFFDIEFILRRNIPLEISDEERNKLLKIISTFGKRDYKVVLGSVLDNKTRAYYTENGFAFLISKLNGT